MMSSMTAAAQTPQDSASTANDTTPHTRIVTRRVPRTHYNGVPRVRHKAPGFRIQVYTGGNNRASKRMAQQMKQKIQKAFPELSVYISFQSPRWICRVGDFDSRKEAQPYARKIRARRISTETNIVSCQILRAY